MVRTYKVKARIMELGLTFFKVAEYLDIDVATLSLKLNNKRRIYLDEVVKVCEILEINTAEQLKEYFNLDFLILSQSHENVTK